MATLHTVYCSACDREVQVATRAEPRDGAGLETPDPASGVCLDYGGQCTGSLCPLFDAPPARMADRLRRSGLRPEA